MKVPSMAKRRLSKSRDNTITGGTGLDVDFPDQTRANLNSSPIENIRAATHLKRKRNLLIRLSYRNQSNYFRSGRLQH